MILTAVIVIAILALIFIYASIRILREYERGVVFTLGRYTGTKGPGLFLLVPFVQQMVRVDLRVVVDEVPPQDVISRDNVSVKVSAVLYFRVVDAERAIIQVSNYLAATSQLAQTTLRWVLGKHDLDQMLAERDKLNADIQDVLDKQTEGWGIKVSNCRVEAHRSRREHGAGHRPTGRGRARAPRQDHQRRGRAAGGAEAGRGRPHPRRRAAGDAAALSRHAVRYRERTRLHDRVSVPDRAGAGLCRGRRAELTSPRSMILAHSRDSDSGNPEPQAPRSPLSRDERK